MPLYPERSKASGYTNDVARGEGGAPLAPDTGLCEHTAVVGVVPVRSERDVPWVSCEGSAKEGAATCTLFASRRAPSCVGSD